MDVDPEILRRVVRDVAADRFGAETIEAVAVHGGFDSDGDPVLMVRIVVDTERGHLDPKALSSFIRHLRPKLDEVGEGRFPITSFVSKKEAAEAGAEAA